jgi:hypothetical protein
VDDREDQPELAPTTALRPRMRGRSLPVPPLIPSVVIVSLVLGLIAGLGLAARPGPPPAPPALALAGSPLPDAAPANDGALPTPFVLPPGGGLTLAQASANLIGALGATSPSAVISARIARFGDVASGALPADRWVWAFVVRGIVDPVSCGPAGPSPQACDPPAPSELAVFDYRTGEFIEDRLPAYP